MHLQAAIEGFDVFARSLSASAPRRWSCTSARTSRCTTATPSTTTSSTPELGDEVLTISRLINAFFRWEFNSCETLVRGTEAHPIDYANASPDVALTSLHYYFPWAMSALLKWCAFCVVTGREPRLDLDTRRYFEIGDREDLSYEEKLAALPRARRRVLRGRPLPATSATAGSRTSTSSCSTGSARPTSTGCCSRPCARPTRRTSTSASSGTSAASSASG